MDTIFVKSENSRTSEYHVLLLKLTDKLNLRRSQKSIALSNLSIYYTWKNISSSYNNNRFKILAPTWSDEVELPDRSYLISDIQDYFEYILKAAATDMRYFVRSKFSRSLVHKKNFSLI